MAVPVMWRTQKQRYSLQAEVCTECSSAVFPPRAVCPYCKTPMRAQVIMQKTSPALPANQGCEFIYALPVATLPMPVAVAGDD